MSKFTTTYDPKDLWDDQTIIEHLGRYFKNTFNSLITQRRPDAVGKRPTAAEQKAFQKCVNAFSYYTDDVFPPHGNAEYRGQRFSEDQQTTLSSALTTPEAQSLLQGYMRFARVYHNAARDCEDDPELSQCSPKANKLIVSLFNTDKYLRSAMMSRMSYWDAEE